MGCFQLLFFSMSNIILSLIFLCCISILPSAFAGRREEALGVGAAHFVSMCCPSRLLLYFTDLLFLWQRHWLIDRFDKPAGGHKYRRSSRKISRERKKEKKTHLIRSSQRGKWGDVSQIPWPSGTRSISRSSACLMRKPGSLLEHIKRRFLVKAKNKHSFVQAIIPKILLYLTFDLFGKRSSYYTLSFSITYIYAYAIKKIV